MTTVVRPFIRCSSARLTACSEAASSPAVGSSRIRIGVLRTIARAIAMRWRWPPDNVTPRSPTMVA